MINKSWLIFSLGLIITIGSIILTFIFQIPFLAILLLFPPFVLTRRSKTSPPQEPRIFYCHNCGTRLSSYDKFCSQCGKPVV
ncbi:MAG: zinc-ribbon domain-containing protein [Candidatus Hermodarchaeota archaeon]